jgi:hypothetical protein
MDSEDFAANEPTVEDVTKNAILVTLVGIKNIKSQNSFRLEFDVAGVDQSKVKNLLDDLYNMFHMILVKTE